MSGVFFYESIGRGKNEMIRTVWKIDKAGSINNLSLQTEDLSKRKSGEVMIEVRSIGLNFADIFALQGLYSATPEGSFIPGLEFCGVVQACSRTSGFKIGDRVMGVTRFGAYASHLNVDARYLTKLPHNWSFAEGAAYLAQALTAWYALHELGNLQKDHMVLVHSAAGGVGLHSLQIIQKAGAHAICTVGNEEKKSFLKKRGVKSDQIIVRNKKSFVNDLAGTIKRNKITGFDLILDAVAGPYFDPGMNHLNPAGRYVIFGAADFMNKNKRPNYLRIGWQYLRRPRLDPVNMISANRSLMAFNLIWLWDHHQVMIKLLGSMKKAGLLKTAPFVGHNFSFADAHEAIRKFQSGKTIGKVVLNI